MHARRIIAVSPDPAFAQQLASALPGVVVQQSVPTVATEASLWVIHLDAARVRDATRLLKGPVIAVVPQGHLATSVELLQAADHVVGVMVAETLDPRQLAAMAARAQAGGDHFGLAEVMAPGTQIHSVAVGDHEDKLAAIGHIGNFAQAEKVPDKVQAPLEQCLDEMLMNALYDAAVDASGKHVFAGVPTSRRITMRTGHEVVVEYACDGKRLAVAVRDAFGSLGRDIVVRHLHKGLYAEHKVDDKAGGAGLGLFLMASSASALYFNVLPGIASEVTCMFELGGTASLAEVGFFVQQDPAGRVASGPARARLAPRAARRRLLQRIGAAVGVAAAVAIAILVWPHTITPSAITFTTEPPGATLDVDGRTVGIARDGTLLVRGLTLGRAHTVTARLDGHAPAQLVVTPREGAASARLELAPLPVLEVVSQPPDAAVVIDGVPMGSTPLVLTGLAAGAKVTLAFEKRGYRAATAALEVPARGARKQHVQALERAEELAHVRFESDPPGAEIARDGRSSPSERIYTPAELFVEAGATHSFSLLMPGHAPFVIEPFVAERGTDVVVKRGELVARP